MLTLGDYLCIYHSEQAQLHLLYESLLESAELSINAGPGTEFRSYFSDELIKAGLSKVK